jgi:hypothetical protein
MSLASSPWRAPLSGSAIANRLGASSMSRADCTGAPSDLTAKDFESLSSVGKLVAHACFFHFAGEDQSAIWNELLERGRPKNAAVRGLLDVLRGLDAPPQKASRRQTLRYPASVSELVKRLGASPTAELSAIAMSPDHPSYVEWMAFFDLPLSLKRAHELSVPPIVTGSLGPWPERRGSLLYARRLPRPAFGTQPIAADPSTWYGFDAIEAKGEEILVYHYVGIAWKAPLAFEEGLNAFAFLEQAPHAWKDVEADASREAWSQIEAAKASGRCTHVVVFDPTEAGASDAAIAAAGAHYGVRLVAKSLFDV